jgi:hypothetical protein
VAVARPLSSLSAWQRGARRRLPLTAPLALGGVIPVLLALLVYELPLFRAPSGCLCGGPTRLPVARHVRDLEIGPVLTLHPGLVTMDNRFVGAPDGDLSALAEDLVTLRRNWRVLHPEEPFAGRVLVEADRRLPYGDLRRVVRVAHAAGYPNVLFVVTAAR